MSRRELTEKQIVQGSLAKMAEDREADREDAYAEFDSWGDDDAHCSKCFELMTEGSAHKCSPDPVGDRDS